MVYVPHLSKIQKFQILKLAWSRVLDKGLGAYFTTTRKFNIRPNPLDSNVYRMLQSIFEHHWHSKLLHCISVSK